MLGRISSSTVAGLLAVSVLGSAPPATAGGGRVVDPGPSVRIAVGHTEVPVDRPTWVRVRVRLNEPASRLRVGGRSDRPDDLRARSVVVEDVAAGRTVVRLPVRLVVHHWRRLFVRAVTSGDHAATAATSVRVRPRG